MPRLKGAILAAAAVAALALLPATPAAAGGFIGPWILGRHVIGAVLGLATLPLAVASAALSADQPAGPYPPTPGYGSGPDYSAPPGYYPRPPVYYAQRQAYYSVPPAYYRPQVTYGRPRFYESPRGYSAPHTRYTGSYGAHVPYRSGSSGYRRR
jgi:hypothetical protein